MAASSPLLSAQEIQRIELPPIKSQGDARFGKPPTRSQSLAEVIAEVVATGKRGTWRIDKRWEVIINSLTSAEIELVMGTVSKLTPSDARDTLRTALYSRWGECDPAAAMRRLALESDLATRGNCLQALFQGWAHANAAEVLAWAEKLPPGDVKLAAYIAAAPYETANGAGKPPAADVGAPRDPRAAVTDAAKIPGREQRLAAYKNIAKEWAAADPAAANQWALGLSIAGEREALLELTIATWARVHPSDALSFLVGHADVPRGLTERTFANWVQRDFPAASRWARQLPDPKQRSIVFLAAEATWLDYAPDEVATFLADFAPGSYEYSMAASNAASRWVESDPPRLFALLRTLPADRAIAIFSPEMLQKIVSSQPAPLLEFLRGLPVGRRADFYASAVAAIAGKSPPDARQALAAFRGEPDENAVRHLLIQRLPESRIDFAQELYRELPAGQPQAEALRFIADRWSRQQPRQALAWVRALPASPATLDVTYGIIRQMGQTDAKVALQELKTLPVSPQRRGMVAELVASWAMKESAPAIAYMQSLPDSDEREAVLLNVAQRIGYSDAPKGLALLTDGEINPARLGAIQQIVTTWGQNDATAARKWVEQQSNVVVRETLMVAMLYPIARSSPAEAAKIASELTQPASLKQGIAAVAQIWTVFDPAAASRWAASASRAEVRTAAITAVGSLWAQNDLSAAAAWLSELPADDVPDETWRNLVQAAFSRRPTDALRYAQRIKDAAARDEVTVRLVSYWLQQNRPEAEKWLATAELRPELREKIRTASETRRGF